VRSGAAPVLFGVVRAPCRPVLSGAVRRWPVTSVLLAENRTADPGAEGKSYEDLRKEKLAENRKRLEVGQRCAPGV